jgi:uncharacterized protein
MAQEKDETRNSMRITWDAPIPMDDGIELRCDVFRPVGDGKYPVIMAMGAYAKLLPFAHAHKEAWDRMAASYPEVSEGTSNSFQNWEVVDPEKWIPDGYACVRVDSRGSGRSPGVLNPWGPREIRDYHDCIEWAARQSWCSGKIGLCGISYLARTQWYVSALKPPHLAAICVWEGAADCYRDITHHGGIVSDFMLSVFPRQILTVQHGKGERGPKSSINGELVAGPETLSDEELAANREDMEKWIIAHPLDDEAHKERTPAWENVQVPLLSAANWGGMGLHPRGNFEGYVHAASREKWLEIHGDTHWTHFYTNHGLTLQKQFFGHFLKGEDTGWTKQPPVQLQVRHVDRYVARAEKEWPLARTQWSRFYLDPGGMRLSRLPSAGTTALRYDALGEGLLFLTDPFETETEITGPVAAKLFVSSSTTDADLFLGVHLFRRDGNEVTFLGANDPHVPVAQGWLRASHRKLDPARTLPYRPYHAHDEIQPLVPGEPVELDIEIWPTSVVVPAGYRLGLTVRGKDITPNDPATELDGVSYKRHANIGPFKHNHPQDRPPELFGGTNALHVSDRQPPYLLLPIIPAGT